MSKSILFFLGLVIYGTIVLAGEAERRKDVGSEVEPNHVQTGRRVAESRNKSPNEVERRRSKELENELAKSDKKASTENKGSQESRPSKESEVARKLDTPSKPGQSVEKGSETSGSQKLQNIFFMIGIFAVLELF